MARRNVAWVTGLALLLIALGFAVTTAVAGRVVKPIETLTTAAARIAAGDLDVAVPADCRDELGVLARSFNDMAARLREVRAADLGALQQARQLAEAAIDALYDPVVVTDATGHITRLDTAAEVVFGRAADATGRPLTAAAPDARMAAVVDEVLLLVARLRPAGLREHRGPGPRRHRARLSPALDAAPRRPR